MSYSNSAAPAMITGDQLRMLYALTRENGMDSDTLHARAKAETGHEHLKELTKIEAARLIDGLLGKKVLYARAERPSTRVTQAQIDVIFGLARRLGWLDSGYDRIKGFVRAQYQVDVIDWMTPEQGRKCIEALKAMLSGGRAERKGRGQNEPTAGEPK